MTEKENPTLLTRGDSEADQRAPITSDNSKSSTISQTENDQAGDCQEFDWDDTESVVLPAQSKVAIYHNPHGDLVIREKAHWGDDEDAIVIIASQNTDAFVDRLCDLIGIPSVGRGGVS
jgi:hypothetical protein